MRGAASCWVGAGPTAQPTSGASPKGCRSSPARAPPRAALLCNRQQELAGDGAGARPAPAIAFSPSAGTGTAAAAAVLPSTPLAAWRAARHQLAMQQQQVQQQVQQQQWWDLEGGVLTLRLSALEHFSSSGSTSSSSGSDSSPPAAASSSLHRVQLNEPPPREQHSASPSPPPPPQDERDPDFFANVGDAIRTLREDYPLLFMKDLNYSIYREDVVFKDPNLTFKGLKNYRIIWWSLRFHGRLFLQAANVRVLRIWQPEDAVIKLRWQINATPRMGGTPGTFDGISVYRLDRHGRVYQHEVTDVQLRDPPITNPLLYGLNYILAPRPQVQQVPCPGSWYQEGEEDLLPEALASLGTAPVLLASGSQD